jgi:hypothetical protein
MIKRLNFLIVALILLAKSLDAQIQSGTFTQLRTPVGVVTDAQGNILISHDNVSAPVVRKFSPNGAQLGAVAVGGFIDINNIGYLARIPASGFVLNQFADGRIITIDPNTLQVVNFLNIRQLQVDVSAVFDLASGTFGNFGGLILPQNSSYGDIAVLQRGNTTDIFVAGLSVAFPFVLRIRFQGNTLQSAKVMISSRASAAPNNNLARGVAVNTQNIVLTTLPITRTGGNFDVAVAFGADFTEGTGQSPQILLNGADMSSRGIGTDARGNFYVATGAIGTSLGGAQGSGAVAIFSARLSPITLITFGQGVFDSRDVAISPSGATSYVTFAALNTVLFLQTGSVTGVNEKNEASVPGPFSLSQNYPNPFNPSTTIEFALPREEHVTLKVYNLVGTEVATLVNRKFPAGKHKAEWNGQNFPSGVYFYRLEAGDFMQTRKLTLVR